MTDEEFMTLWRDCEMPQALRDGNPGAPLLFARALLAQHARPPLTEQALQSIAEELGRACHVWEGVGARDIELVLKLAQGWLPLTPIEPVAWAPHDFMRTLSEFGNVTIIDGGAKAAISNYTVPLYTRAQPRADAAAKDAP